MHALASSCLLRQLKRSAIPWLHSAGTTASLDKPEPRWRTGDLVAPKQSCHVRLPGMHVPAWQLDRAETCGVIFYGVAPRDLVRPKGPVFGNINLPELLIKY